MVDSLNLSVAGKPYVATQTGDGKINLASPDGKDAQSMDIEQFKKYLAEHANEIKIAAPAGDTLEKTAPAPETAKPSFKGHGDEETPEKKGLSTGTKILIGAGIIALGVWKKDLVVKYWNKLFNKGAAAAQEAVKATKEGKLTEAAAKHKTTVAEALKPKTKTNTEGVNSYVAKFEKDLEIATNPNGPEHVARQKELEEAFSAVA